MPDAIQPQADPQPVRFYPPAFAARPPWLGGDLQTVRNYLLRPVIPLDAWPGERLLLTMADGSGDRLSACLQMPDGGAARPLVALVHGLTGCEDSSYMRGSARHFLRLGHPVLRLNLRGAGPSRETCRQQYHSGRSEDLRDALRALAEWAPDALSRGLLLIGYSLGANMLIKFLAEHGEAFPVLGGVAVSAPIDLKAAQVRLMTPRNRLYHHYLLQRMKREALAAPVPPADAERAAIAGASSVFDFDERVTAPRNGFAGAEDYYSRCSALGFLPEVRVPTLVIHALNDPWIPAKAYLDFDWRRVPTVTPVLPRAGGHVGFHGRGSKERWHDRCAAVFFAALREGPKKSFGAGPALAAS